jgi:ferric-dicitrate binding protein FerR (iron transport regulator)
MGARKWVAGLVSVTLLICPAAAAQASRPVGLVVVAHKAQLEAADALQGASVFAPQKFSTRSGGALSIRLEQAQLTLNSDSRARLESRDGQLRTILDRGVMRMEWSGGSAVELRALDVAIRPQDSAPTLAEIGISGKGELLLTSHGGALEATYAGVKQVIPAGTTYKAVLTPDAEAEAAQAQQPQGAGRRRRMAPIVWFAIGAAAAVSLWLLLKDHREAVSPTIP